MSPRINFPAREINCNLVYYGPGLGGKTTNVRCIHRSMSPLFRGELLSLDTDHDRTLFFDFLPLKLGQIRGYNTRFFLYTVPGQTYYNSTRRQILKGVDGIIFVADSQPHRWQANLESFRNLEINLMAHNLDVNELPLVFQYNKRDLPGATPLRELSRALNKRGVPEFAAVATRGQGVFSPLKEAMKMVMANLDRGNFSR